MRGYKYHNSDRLGDENENDMRVRQIIDEQ